MLRCIHIHIGSVGRFLETDELLACPIFAPHVLSRATDCPSTVVGKPNGALSLFGIQIKASWHCCRQRTALFRGSTGASSRPEPPAVLWMTGTRSARTEGPAFHEAVWDTTPRSFHAPRVGGPLATACVWCRTHRVDQVDGASYGLGLQGNTLV